MFSWDSDNITSTVKYAVDQVTAFGIEFGVHGLDSHTNEPGSELTASVSAQVRGTLEFETSFVRSRHSADVTARLLFMPVNREVRGKINKMIVTST